MKPEFVIEEVERLQCVDGREYPSPWSEAYYASQVVFPNATDAQWRLIADVLLRMQLMRP